MALSIFPRWVLQVCRSELLARAGLLCASLALVSAAACDDAFSPRPRPTGLTPDTTSANISLRWYELQPRAVTIGQTDSVRVTVAVQGTPLRVQLELETGTFQLVRQTNGTYARTLAVHDLLFGYRTGDLHNTPGFVDVVTSTSASQRSLFIINVKDGSVPNTGVQTHVAGLVQSASHVVNLRADSVFTGAEVPAAILQTFYQHFPDVYDFINVVQQVQRPAPTAYFAVRNTITGLGVQELDRSARYGNPQRLQGTLVFPNEGYFDPAETLVLHELAHRWMNFSNIPSVHAGRPHWPISTLARGVVGVGDPTTGAAIPFSYSFTRQPNGTYSVSVEPTRPVKFNDFELYLLGLIPPDSVASHIVFLNQQFGQLRQGGIMTGAIDTVTVAEWIARDGPRVPAVTAAQRQFRMATIVLSQGRLLSSEEISYFNHMAARGELKVDVPFPVVVDTVRTTTLPFFGATGGRAELITRLFIPSGS